MRALFGNANPTIALNGSSSASSEELDMANSPDAGVHRGSWGAVVLLLTWVAGSVDAISYFGLAHVFTANMTGNTVLLGLALGQGQGLAAIRSVFALVGYVAGVALGVMIMGGSSSSVDTNRSVPRALFGEAVVLTLFTITWHVPALARNPISKPALIVLSAIAMGIQSAAVRKLKLPGIVTTFITGTITSLVSGLVSRIQLRAVPVAPAPSTESGWERHVSLQAGVIFVYGLAAAISALLQTHVPSLVAISPLIAIGLVLLETTLAVRPGQIVQQG
jgi:uncharacterized membrane protein YoaK (UPF0700 family)